MDKRSFPPRTIPPDNQLADLSRLLYQSLKKQKQNERYASAKVILSLLGMGVTMVGAFFAPKAAATVGKKLLHELDGQDKWKSFNQAYLRQTLRRLEKQNLIEINTKDRKEIITITSKGKKKILQYGLADLHLTKPPRWDRKWRIVMYDIPKEDKHLEELVRKTLKRMGLYPIQESVYLTPHPCYDEIEFMRRYYNLEPFMKYMVVQKIEDDTAYKTFFDL